MDAATVRAWATAAARALDAARGPIDSLNVFPVPDGDTGTNLALTVAEGAEHVIDPGPDAAASAVAAAFARGALLGARGNSGVIVSQYLHGFAAGLAAAADAEPAGVTVARALDEAQRAAWAAVARPVEGTILTAASAAGVAAVRAAQAGGSAQVTAAAALAGAREALARSPQALDVLRAAGVVDAGATGLVVLLAALAEAVGHPVPGPAPAGAAAADLAAVEVLPVDVPRADPPPADASAGAHRSDDGEFEVMYVVEPHRPVEAAVDLGPDLRARLEAVGSSVAVVGGADGWHVHVHTDRPDEAVAVGDLGARSQVVVRRLAPASEAAGPGPGLGVVAGTSAPGLAADLARSGALVLVLTGWPVTARVMARAVVDTGAARVVVLPGSPSAHAAAVEAAGTAEVTVEVLDATDDMSVVVAVTALADGPGPHGTHGSDPVAAARHAVAGVRTGAVADPDPDAVLAAARALLGDDGEVLTVLRGSALTARAPGGALLRALTAGLAASHPDVEVVVLCGEQPEPAALLAVE